MASADLATVMRRMVGFRNILVHGYELVDVGIVRDIVEHQLEDLLRFVNLIRPGCRETDHAPGPCSRWRQVSCQ